MTTTAWFNASTGIAGDMALGALIDAGAQLDVVRRDLGSLAIDNWGLTSEKVLRAGISCTKVHVQDDSSEHHRDWRTIRALIAAAPLPERARDRSLRVFAALATAEAAVHGVAVDDVHFHEVGGIDSIIDVVGTCLALEQLGVASIRGSAIAVGSGAIQAAHGMLPNPPPAVGQLLRGLPVKGHDLPHELSTPTGVAILAALSEDFGAMPDLSCVAAIGYGAGSRDIEGMPNCTQVVIGEISTPQTDGQAVDIVECNIDDASGEALAYTVQRLLHVGALDAWITPVVGKKGRPAYVVSALSDPSRTDQIITTVMHETGSYGARTVRMSRRPAARRFMTVLVEGHPIRIKVADHRAKAEYEDAARAAAHLGLPVREVLVMAERAWATGAAQTSDH